MLDFICLADHVEPHLWRRCTVPVAGLLGELDDVSRQDRMDAFGNRLQPVLEELSRSLSIHPMHELGDGERRCPINAYEKVKLFLDRPNIGDVDVE